MASGSRPRSRLTLQVRRDVLVDRAALRLVASRIERPSDELVARITSELDAANDLFGTRGWLADPAIYHLLPPPISSERTRSARVAGLRVTSLTWPDGFACRAEEPGALRYETYTHNKIARATLLEHPHDERPWLVCIHGFGMGSPGFDLRAFRAGHLHHRLGMNVAFLALPFHGRRRGSAGAIPHVPGVDILDTVHAVAQSVWDARQLLRRLQSTTDHPVGLAGLSFGALVAAIVASVEEPHAVAALVPLVDLEALLVDGAERFGIHDKASIELVAAARSLLAMVSATSYDPSVPISRRMIVAGTLDRFVPASSHSHALWRHWHEPQIHWFHGGHVSMYWAPSAQPALDRMLRQAGMAAE